MEARVAPPSFILTYHHVADARIDPGGLCVSPGNFSEQIEVLRHSTTPVALADMLRHLFDGDLPPGTVAVTFDDGYLDNLENAKPVLERYQVPATAFVTAADGARPWFWWDVLEWLLLHSHRLPDHGSLAAANLQHDWQVEAHAPSAAAALAAWKVWEPPPTRRHRLFVELSELLVAMPPGVQRSAIEQLVAWADVPLDGVGHFARLSDTEIVALARGGLIDVGSHTASHALLPLLPAADQTRDISAARSYLELLLGRRVQLFAYPYGRFTAETAGIVREQGHLCGCTTTAVPIGGGSDVYRLPRFHAPDLDGSAFRGWLRSLALVA